MYLCRGTTPILNHRTHPGPTFGELGIDPQYVYIYEYVHRCEECNHNVWPDPNSIPLCSYPFNTQALSSKIRTADHPDVLQPM